MDKHDEYIKWYKKRADRDYLSKNDKQHIAQAEVGLCLTDFCIAIDCECGNYIHQDGVGKYMECSCGRVYAISYNIEVYKVPDRYKDVARDKTAIFDPPRDVPWCLR